MLIYYNISYIKQIHQMENIFFGFFTGGSLILAIGPQNLFVIEQGLKRNYVFLVTTLCTLSDIF